VLSTEGKTKVVVAQKFISPYSLNECMTRLKTLTSGQEAIFGSTVVSVWKIEEERLGFSIRRWKFLNLVTQISGSLIYVSNTETEVISKSSISLYLLLMFIIYMTFGSIILFGYVVEQRYDLVPVALFGLGFGVFTWYFWNRWRVQLDNAIRSVLSD
jgi:hypothetical protein